MRSKSGASLKGNENDRRQKRARILSFILRCLQRVLFFLPLKKNRVMVYVHQRKGFTCNSKYVVQKLLEIYGDQLELMWVTAYPETCRDLCAKKVTVCATNSKTHIVKYIRTKVYVTNDLFPAWALHRSKQIWINVWHGGMNYKHIGYDYLEPMCRAGERLFWFQNRKPDIYFAGSRYFKEDTAASFHLPESVFWETGMPRNDIFFEDHSYLQHKIRKRYGVAAETKIVMYAPTFRSGMEDNTYGLDFAGLTDALSERFGGTWVVFFRNHNFVESSGSNRGQTVDVSDYDDMQELLYVLDVLISDYSSCMWDFCLTGRPCFVYAEDIEYYTTKDRTLSLPLQRWPYPIAETNEQLRQCILAFDDLDYRNRIQKHLKEIGSYDNGTASEQAASIIGKYCIDDCGRI